MNAKIRPRVIFFVEEAKLGGPQVQMVSVASALKKSFDITLVLPKENNSAFTALCKREAIDYIELPISRLTKQPFVLLRYIFFFPIEIWVVLEAIKKIKPDLIHAWGGAWQMKASTISKLLRIPLVWLLNDTKSPKLIRQVFKCFAPRAAGFICASNKTLDYYKPYIPSEKKVSVIQSYVRCEDELAVQTPTEVDRVLLQQWGNKFVVGMVANINPIKGIEDFIRVAALVNEERNGDFEFVVVGAIYQRQATYYQTLKQLKNELGASNISFVGHRNDVQSLLRRFDTYLCTSLAESSPVAVWEALAAGCPIVSTDVGDVSAIIGDNEAGFVSPVGSCSVMADSIQFLYKNHSQRMKMQSNARKVASKFFGKKATVEPTGEFYHLILEQGEAA